MCAMMWQPLNARLKAAPCGAIPQCDKHSQGQVNTLACTWSMHDSHHATRQSCMPLQLCAF